MDIQSPHFGPDLKAQLEGPNSFQKGWQIRLRDNRCQNALEIRFSFLVSRNGFQRRAEVCAILFQRTTGGETKKTVLKQTFEPASLEILSQGGFRIGTCELSRSATRGSIQAKGQTITWDLSIGFRQKIEFDLIPPGIRNLTMSKTSIASVEGDAVFNGYSALQSEKIEWQQAHGILECHSGPLTDHSWIWAHSNHFVSESGVPVPFVFKGLSLRSHILGLIPSPQFSSFHFMFKGKAYDFNSLKDFLRIKSRSSATEWHFQAEQANLLFRGHAKVEPKDFAGLTLEDTQGSLLYCSTSELSDVTVHIYRDGKLESALRAEKSASMEIVSMKKNPYVPLLA
jgi:hypothetical protein